MSNISGHDLACVCPYPETNTEAAKLTRHGYCITGFVCRLGLHGGYVIVEGGKTRSLNETELKQLMTPPKP